MTTSILALIPSLLWALWFSVLAGTPYSIGASYGPAFSPAQLFLAAGILCAIIVWAVHKTYPQTPGSRFLESRKCVITIIVIGVLLTLVAIVPEWLALIARVSPEVSAISLEAAAVYPSEMFGRFWNVPILLIASFVCGITGCALDELRALRPTGMLSQRFDRKPLRLFALGILTGFCVRLTTLAFASPRTDYDLSLLPFGVALCISTIPIFLTGIAVASIIVASRSDEKQTRNGQEAIPAILTGLSLGFILWSFLLRIIAIENVFSPTLAILICAIDGILILVFGFHHERRPSRPAAGESKRETAASTPPENVIKNLGLSPREAEAATLIFQGNSSEEAAAVMSIQPATVRSLLRRAYAKTGVTNKDDFLKHIRDGAGISKSTPLDSAPLDSPKKARSTDLAGQQRMAISLAILPWSFAAFLCIVVLPHHIPSPIWGAGREMIYGTAFGILMACAAMAISQDQNPLERFDSHGRIAPAACFLAFSATGALSLALAVVYATAPFVDTILSLAIFLSNACLGLSAVFCIRTIWSIRSITLNCKTLSPIMPLCFISLALASFLSVALWIATGIICIAAITTCSLVAARAFPQAMGREASHTGTTFYQTLIDTLPFAIAFLSFGMLWEEAWRAEGYASFFSLGIPFIASIIVFSFYALGKLDKKRCLTTGLFCIIAVISSLAIHDIPALALAMCVFIVFSAWEFSRGNDAGDRLPANTLVVSAAAFAIGAVAGDFAGNLASDHLHFISSAQSSGLIAGFNILETPFAYCAGILFIGASIAVAILCLGLVNSLSIDKTLMKQIANSEARARSYLIGRGFSESGATILVDIARGETISSIEQNRHYARGTIQSVRHTGYRKLGINSRTQLVELLAKEIS